MTAKLPNNFVLIVAILAVTACQRQSELSYADIKGVYKAKDCQEMIINHEGTVFAGGQKFPSQLKTIKGTTYLEVSNGILISSSNCEIMSSNVPLLLPVVRSNNIVTIRVMKDSYDSEVVYTLIP